MHKTDKRYIESMCIKSMDKHTKTVYIMTIPNNNGQATGRKGYNMNYIETRTLSADDLRALCIRNNWYTRGTNAEYEALFDSLYDEDGCNLNLTTEKLAEIAENIMEHSRIQEYTITTVMYALNRACTVLFDQI